MKKIKKNLVLLILGLSLMLEACAKEKSHEAIMKEIEQNYDEKRRILEQEKENLIQTIAALEKELEQEKAKANILEEELKEIKEKYGVKGEKDYTKEDLILISDQNGEDITYHFIEYDSQKTYEYENRKIISYKYRTLTNASKTYDLDTYIYENNDRVINYFDYHQYEKNGYYYIPDYNLYFATVIEKEDIPFPKEYENQKIYSYEELVEIENKLNEEEYDIYEEKKDQKYKIENLVLINMNGKFLFLDTKAITIEQNENKEKIDGLYLYEYWVSVTHKNFAIKNKAPKNIGYDKENESYLCEFEKITCTNHEDYVKYMDLIEWSYQNIIIEMNVAKYFNKEEVEYQEISKAEKDLNQKYYYQRSFTK